MLYAPGEFVTFDDSTFARSGATVDADSLPTAVIRRNGVIDNAVTVTVALSGNQYNFSFTIPTGYGNRDLIEVVVTAIVGGIPATKTLWRERLDFVSVTISDYVPAPNLAQTIVQLSLPCGFTFYFLLKNRSGFYFNTTSGSFEALNTANWSLYAIPLVEAVLGTGDFFGTLPGNFPAGIALVPVMTQAASSPASTDCGQGLVMALDWSGVAINTFTPLPRNGGTGPVQIPQVQSDLGTAQNILNNLYTARMTNPNGIHEINVDGQLVSYKNSNDLDLGIQFWERKVAILSGKRARVNTISLGGF